MVINTWLRLNLRDLLGHHAWAVEHVSAFDRKLTLGILLCLSTVDLVTNISRFYIGQKCSINLVNYHVIFVVGLGSLVEWLILRLAHAFADVLGQIGRVFGP